MIIPIKLEKRTEGEREAYAEGYAAGKRDAVRHGRWIDKSSSTDEYGNPISMCQDRDRYINIICSVCGYSITDRYGLYHYCPNCGASMVNEDE